MTLPWCMRDAATDAAAREDADAPVIPLSEAGQ